MVSASIIGRKSSVGEPGESGCDASLDFGEVATCKISVFVDLMVLDDSLGLGVVEERLELNQIFLMSVSGSDGRDKAVTS